MTLIWGHLFVLFGSWFETRSHTAQDGFETWYIAEGDLELWSSHL